MATYLENLTAARDGFAAKLAATATGDYSKAIELKPNFNSASGVDRIEYVKTLRDMIDGLNKQISQADPFEVLTEMTT